MKQVSTLFSVKCMFIWGGLGSPEETGGALRLRKPPTLVPPWTQVSQVCSPYTHMFPAFHLG